MQNAYSGANSKSALGMEGNITAALGYVIGIVALVLFFIEKENKFVKFHAIQSVLWGVALSIAGVIVGIALGIFAGILGQISGALASVFGILLLLFYPLFFLVVLGGLLFAAYKAYQGATFKLPFVGNFAERFAA